MSAFILNCFPSITGTPSVYRWFLQLIGELHNVNNPLRASDNHQQTVWRQNTVLSLSEIKLKNLLLSLCGYSFKANEKESTSCLDYMFG